jgi:flavin reductase (DIM6/NTAB) family NADH-FMN oxidoreductase RutF
MREIIMSEWLQNLDSVLRSTPSALLTYFSKSGDARMRAVEWVGVVCSQPALLTVYLRRPLEDSKEGLHGREFVVNLPTPAQLASLPPMEGADCAGFQIPSLLMDFQEAATICAPLIADSPIRLECRQGTSLVRFEREVISAPISAVHIGGHIYGNDSPPDIYRLTPLSHPLVVSRASGGNLVSDWKAPHRRPENSSCF